MSFYPSVLHYSFTLFYNPNSQASPRKRKKGHKHFGVLGQGSIYHRGFQTVDIQSCTQTLREETNSTLPNMGKGAVQMCVPADVVKGGLYKVKDSVTCAEL